MLTKEILCAYAPHGVQMALIVRDEIILIDTIRSIHDINDYDDLKVSIGHYDSEHIWMYKPLLRPLSSLTKPINHNGDTFVFSELFEIGDDGGFIHDFGNNNTKLIKDLENIAKYNCYHDINYLPHPVVKLMYQFHFDVHGLLESGNAIELKEVDNG